MKTLTLLWDRFIARRRALRILGASIPGTR